MEQKQEDIKRLLNYVEKVAGKKNAECEPLIMTHLIRKGMTPCDYICGKQGGVRWSFITDIPEDKNAYSTEES